MKKLQLFSLFFALPLIAGSHTNNDDLQREVDQLKLRVDRLSSGSGMHTPEMPEKPTGTGFGVSADVLFWQTQSDQSIYSYQLSQTFDTTVPSSNLYNDADIDWAWGFRVGASYTFDYDNWKLGAEYTYLRPDGSATRSVGEDVNGGFSLANMSIATSSNYGTDGALLAKSAKTDYNLYYDVVNLQLSRGFCVTSNIDFVTHWGLAAAWISEDQKNTYTGGTDTGYLGGTTLVNENNNNYWGIGPVGGLGAFWHMGMGFSIFGDLTGEILVGKLQLSRTEQRDGSSTDFVKIVFDGYRYRPQLMMQLGLGYDTYFNDGSQHFGIRAGWENQVWFSQSARVQESTSVTYGDLQFSGVTLRFLFDF